MKTRAVLSDSPREEEKIVQASAAHPKKKYSLSFSDKRAIVKSTSKEILLFIVDDDPIYLKAFEQSVSNKLPLIKIKTFLTGEACLQKIILDPDVVILDYFLDSKVPYAWNGLTVLKQIKKLNSKTKVIMLSAQDSLDIAEKCIDSGSYDYISKSESAFVKINNTLLNIIEDKTMDKGIKPYQIIGIVVIIILILSYLLLKK